MDSEVGPLGSRRKLSEEEEEVQIFVTQMLMSRLFLGDFQERRYVELINNYRDVIVIDQQHGDLKRDLDIVRKRLDGYYNGRLWIGITGPNMIGTPSGHCLWVQLPNQPLGQYWFFINKITFLPNEVIIKLKKVRMSPSSTKSTSEQYVQNKDDNNEFLGFLTNLSMKSTSDAFTKQFIPALLSVLTFHNIKQTILFLSVLFLAIVTGVLNCLKYLGDYSIAFLREFNGCIRAATPFMLGVLDLISKVVGGFYILLAMIWKGNSGPNNATQNLMMMNQTNSSQLQLTSVPAQQQTYANFRQKYQNSNRYLSSAYSRHTK